MEVLQYFENPVSGVCVFLNLRTWSSSICIVYHGTQKEKWKGVAFIRNGVYKLLSPGVWNTLNVAQLHVIIQDLVGLSLISRRRSWNLMWISHSQTLEYSWYLWNLKDSVMRGRGSNFLKVHGPIYSILQNIPFMVDCLAVLTGNLKLKWHLLLTLLPQFLIGPSLWLLVSLANRYVHEAKGGFCDQEAPNRCLSQLHPWWKV